MGEFQGVWGGVHEFKEIHSLEDQLIHLRIYRYTVLNSEAARHETKRTRFVILVYE